MAEGIVLRAGCAPWLRHAHLGAGAAAVLALLTAGADPAWTAAALAALLVTHEGCARRMADARLRGRLHLAPDGDVLLFTAYGVHAMRQQPGGWHSRLLCVLPLADSESGRCRRVVVCRSLNRPDAYRRLLLRQRLPVQDGVVPVSDSR